MPWLYVHTYTSCIITHQRVCKTHQLAVCCNPMGFKVTKKHIPIVPPSSTHILLVANVSDQKFPCIACMHAAQAHGSPGAVLLHNSLHFVTQGQGCIDNIVGVGPREGGSQGLMHMDT